MNEEREQDDEDEDDVTCRFNVHCAPVDDVPPDQVGADQR
jgi:hypothetical protein